MSSKVAVVGVSTVIIVLGLAGSWFYQTGDLQRWYTGLTEGLSSLTVAEEAAPSHAGEPGLVLPDPLPESTAGATPAEEGPDGSEPTAIAMLPAADPDSESIPEASGEGAERNRERISDYLARFDLQADTGRVMAAMQSGRTGELEREILAPRGLMLHRGGGELTELSRPLLTLPGSDGIDAEHWVIWRPEFRVELMEYGREGEGIRRLQQRLAVAGLYDGAIDGISGPLTFSSLIEFQREHGLPGTGQVDDATLLWLHEYEDAVP